MSKGKAKTITGIIGVMVLMILYGMNRLYPEAYLILLGALGVVGYVAVTILLYRWMRPEERVRAYLAPPLTGGGPAAGDRKGEAKQGRPYWKNAKHGGTPGAASPTEEDEDEGETVKVWTPGETEARAVETGIDPAKLNEIIGEVGEWEKVTA